LKSKRKLSLNTYCKWILLSLITGISAGITSAIFLHLLKLVTETRLQNSSLIWSLPIAGLFIGGIYHLYGKEVVRGNSLILEEIHDPKNVLPLRMAPMILLGTITTHLFGGSAGREGTAVQMSASIADNIGKFFGINSNERKVLMMAGVGAGFGSAIGAPLAGMIFGMEVIAIGRLRLHAWPQCLIASFTGYYTALFLKIPHTYFQKIEIPSFNFKMLLTVLLSGLIFGFTAMFFSRFTHLIERTFKKIIKRPYLIPFTGGMIIVILYHFEGSYLYAGLGFKTIQESLEHIAAFKTSALKLCFTSLTIGTGFIGGEFVPLVFIGTTLGSALASILPATCSFLGALGFASVFAGAANTPLACAIMAFEIFGFKIFPYALLACYLSYYSSGHRGIYRSQKIHRKKHHHLQKFNFFS
jgi:H+/Cl- antiporter ClcA